jgi:hypothetical protein
MVAAPTEQMLAFEEGERVGGRVLYEEDPARFKRRRTEAIAIGAFFLGSLVWLPPVFLALAIVSLVQDPWNPIWLLGLVVGLPILALCVKMAWNGRRSIGLMTRKRICEGGYSSGWGERPFYPKSLFYAIDERKGLRRNTPYAVITLVGGFSFSISSAPVRQSTTETDYQEMLAAFREMMGHRERDRRWNGRAWQVTSNARHYRGPLRAICEDIANKRGAEAIDEAFLESHWDEIQKAMLPQRLTAFRRFAAMEPHADPLRYASAAGERPRGPK